MSTEHECRPADPNTPEIRWLAALAGNFDAELLWWFQPGADALNSSGRLVRTMDLGGLFLRGSLDAEMPGAGRFTSLEFCTFNSGAIGGGRYEVVRMSSGMSALIVETGTLDGATQALTTKGEYDFSGMRCGQRCVMTAHSPDHQTIDIYMEFAGMGGEFLGCRADLRRTK